jgi:hypothetical protein
MLLPRDAHTEERLAVPASATLARRSAMDSMAGIPRNASVEELALSMFGAGAAGFRLGRTPSEAEFSQFLSAGGLAPGGDGDMPGGGMHRVASIDLLRRMVMSQQAAISQAAAAGEAHGDAGHTPVATGLAGGALTAGACAPGALRGPGLPRGWGPVSTQALTACPRPRPLLRLQPRWWAPPPCRWCCPPSCRTGARSCGGRPRSRSSRWCPARSPSWRHLSAAPARRRPSRRPPRRRAPAPGRPGRSGRRWWRRRRPEGSRAWTTTLGTAARRGRRTRRWTRRSSGKPWPRAASPRRRSGGRGGAWWGQRK